MLNTIKDISLIGKNLRNRTMFDIFDKPIDYNLFVKSVFQKRLYIKDTIKKFGFPSFN